MAKIDIISGFLGAGKTTLLNCISRQLHFDGNIEYGKEGASFAYVFQQPRLIPSMTVEDNIKFVLPKDLSKEQVEERVNDVIIKLQLEECRKSYPSKISGGQAGRASLARALVKDCDVLLMDEPFKGLDIKLKKEILSLLIPLIKQKSVIFVTHDVEDALAIADRVYKGKKEKRLSGQKSHTIHYGYIMDGEFMIDEVLVMLMRGPHSYTGEDTVEINCHGGVYVVKRILELLISRGARPAEPGEFTKRAFLNGRLDLSQAEAVGDLIVSQNQYALRNSVSQLRGNIRDKITGIREQIIYHTAFIETALDDPEHISVDGYGDKLREIVENLRKEIQKLIDTYDSGRIMKEGIQTVILGRPNAGKSSLMNVLLGEDRAIVTDIAGTTRDILEEHINLEGISLNIVDTAGIRQTQDVVEQIGVERARSYADQADLIIYVIDASMPLDENDHEILRLIEGKTSIILLNKSDLDTVVTEADVERTYFASNPSIVNGKEIKKFTIPVISISATEKNGINQLEETLKLMFFEGNLAFNDEIYITNIRQKTALWDALSSLEKVIDSIEAGMPEDFYSIDLMDAYEALGRITGETMGEDLVNEIFSKFCMGK